ncbi:MAG: cation:proton antiporter [Myxococcota bacterium]
MHASYLFELVVMAAAALAVVYVFRRLKLPALAGFIAVGVALGPDALGWVRDPDHVHQLAEIGVILLLFGIGTELSLARMRSLWVSVLLGGGAQLTLTIATVTLIGLGFGLSWTSAVAIGAVLSVSSTAIVLRELSEQQKLGTSSGRFALGVLICQDLAVVPMMLLLGMLGTDEWSLVTAGATVGRTCSGPEGEDCG